MTIGEDRFWLRSKDNYWLTLIGYVTELGRISNSDCSFDDIGIIIGFEI